MAFLPALLTALFAAWCGTFDTGASWPAAAVGWLAVLGLAGMAGGDFRDALGLGRKGAWLPFLLAAAIAVSAALSPVPRAGRAVLILLPAFYLLPGAVARCWQSPAARRWGLRSLSLVVGSLALWALIAAWRLHLRPSLPLGQSNVLALWLVTLLPLTLLAGREAGGWRLVAALAGGLGVAALAATGSRSAGLAVLVEAGVVFLSWRGRPRWVGAILVAGAVLVLAAAAPRWLHLLGGADPSWNARRVYFRAALAGFAEQPVLGWGPGSAPWMVGWFYRPIPGVNPPGEVVGDFHSLPLHLAFELGGAGVVLAAAVAWVFFRRRLRELPAAQDSTLLKAGLLGCAGFAVASLGQAALAIAAVPVAVAVAAGAALAGGGGVRPPGRKSLVLMYALAAALLLSPLELARRRYDRAVAEVGRGDWLRAHAELKGAVELDPAFPLYRMHYALTAQPFLPQEALRAAEDGRGVGALWLVAGALLPEGEAARERALSAACALVPFNGLPPFFQALAAPESPAAGRQAARALLAEPRLLAAIAWRHRPRFLALALAEIQREGGVDPGWREALLAAAHGPERPGEEVRLALELDGEAERSLSLYAFRRRPLPVSLPVVSLASGQLPPASLPAASDLQGTSPELFSPRSCAAVSFSGLSGKE